MKTSTLVILCLTLTSACFSETWTVDDDGADYPQADFDNIQTAVNAASSGDEILIYPGTYTTTSMFADAVVEIPSGKNLWLHSVSGPEGTVIDAQNEYGRAGLISYSVLTIEGLSITNGEASYYGGGLQTYGGTIRDCIITGNTSGWDGGGVFNGGSTTISIIESTISQNQSLGGYGGGIAIDQFGIASIDNCIISDNSSYRRGGGVYIDRDSQISIANSTLENNLVPDSLGRGGGVFCSADSSVTLSDTSFSGNSTGWRGGGMYVYRSNLTAVNCDLSINSTIEDGGAVYTEGVATASFTGCTVRDNTAGVSGGGLFCRKDSAVSLAESILCGNSPNNIVGPWTSDKNVCDAISCDDANGNGMPDDCESPDGAISVPGDYPTIQAAIDASSDGDSIYVGPGTWTGSGESVIDLLGKAVSVQSTHGSVSTIIDGEGLRRAVVCMNDETPATILEGFTITGGFADEGGGVYFDHSSPTLIDCIIVGNSVQDANAHGGGIFCWRGSPLISNCTISGNTSIGSYADGGGIHFNESSVVLSDCTISENMSLSGGGLSILAGTPTINNCIFTGNWVTDEGWGDGGAIFIRAGGEPLVTNCQFTDNSAYWGGGGVGSLGASPVISGCTFSNNNARNGAGIYFALGTEQVSNCTFSGNEALQGGGLYCGSGSTSTITDCTITTNDAGSGAGLFCSSSATSTTMVNCQIDFNTAGSGGGVTSSNGNLQLIDCSINNNQLNSGPGWGGGVECINQGSISLQNCTIQGNWVNLTRGSTQNRGGGLFCAQSSFIGLEDCSISSNSASMGDGLIVEDASIISWTGVNIVQYDDILCEDPGSLLHFTADSICTVDEELEPSEDGVLRFDIDFFATAPSLQVGDRFIVQGGLAVTNESGSFASSNIGDYIPLIQVADIVGSVFDSIVFPAMPEGLGLQLAQQDGFRGTGTEIGVEVIGIDGAQFANPFLGDLDNPFVDIVAFDADGDGIDEIAILFDGTPGSISTYSVTQDASPTLIDGLVESVGNGPVDIDAGDIDGDGLCDLLVTNATDSTITVLMTEVAADASLYFSILTIDMSGSGSQSLSCGAVIDWDGIDPLDAVVGIDRADPFQKDVLQVMLDIGSTLTTGPTFEIPMFVIDDELFADTPMAVDGGEFLDASARWGFASGTRYGRVHHADQNTNGLQTLAELGISRVVSIESLDLDDGGGDGIQDLIVVSDEAETIYLFQGDVAETDGFGNLIALTVSERVEDVVAIDADADGDMDLVFTVPSSENPLGLLRNDGTVQPLVATLGGRTWSRQEFDSITPVTRLASGGLEGKDDEDDWVIGGGNQSSNLLGDPQGVMEQTNILIGSICESDFNHDTIVDVNDLLILIAAWGNCDSCQEDINDDAIVDVNDLLIVIAAWGPCK